ncbi:Clp protease ClpP [Alkalihalobacillus pseudalcaliphilus]|nr:Clp protease ClpP [Alkalihalobacillus pseudalcaliphilus]
MKRFKNEKFNEVASSINHEFKASTSGDTTELTIYGDIGESWWYDSVSANDVREALKNVETDNIDVHINSAGGDVFDGIAIYNQLKNHKARVTVYVDGWAASAASVIAMAADELIMNTGSMLMIHEAWTFAIGNKSDIEKTLNSLKGVDKSIVDIYMTRFKGERSEIETMLQNETWFTSDEAVDIGLADRVNEVVKDDDTAPEEYKNSVLQRFRAHKVHQEQNTFLNKFKRQN